MEADVLMSERAKLEQQNRQGSAWFFWIAGLSLVNSLIILTGNEWSFIIGLGITQIIDAVAVGLSADLGNAATFVALFLDLLVAAAFVGLGLLARRGYQAVYLLGMIVYAFDGMIFLVVQDWLSIGFHVFALFCIFSGFKASRALAEMERHPTPSVA